MENYHQKELALSLSAPFCSLDDLRRLALVSRNVAEIVFPRIFQTLRPLVTGQWGTCDVLGALITSKQSWRHAPLVRNLIFRVGKSGPSAGPRATLSAEALIAAVILKLPNVQHIQIESQLPPSESIYKLRPARNFEPIAKALQASSRLCSVDISGSWTGGWTCSVDYLKMAGEYVRDLGVTISARRDGALYAAFCGLATRLENLTIRGMVESDVVGGIVMALPRPDRLRSLKVEIKSSGRELKPWWQESFFEKLSGLQKLEVTATSLWADYDHSSDPNSFEEISYTLPTDHSEVDRSFHQFLSEHPVLRNLQVRAGPCPFRTVQKPPFVYSINDAYDVGLLRLAEAEAHLPHAAHLEDSGITTPEGFARVDRARQAQFVTGESVRVHTWAKNIRKDFVMEARTIASVAPALREVRWYPYEAASEEDGEYLLRAAFQRTRWDQASISGGMGHYIAPESPSCGFGIAWAFEQA